MADSLIGAMQPAVREQYASLQERNARLLSTFESMQQEVDALGTRKVNLEGELAMSKVKQDAVSLYQALSELEEQHANLLSEETQRGTPAQERERLFAQVKDDNAEIAVMERQSTEIQDALRNMEEEIEQLDMELEESQSERSQKYRELRKREETMDSFMATFDETWSAEQERLEQTEGAVVELLQRISRSLTHFGNLPSTSEFAAMQDDLDFKEGELTKSRTTVDGLGQEKLQLQANLEKIDALEEKVKTELEEIKEKKHKMEEEMAVFRDLDALREQSRSKELILFEDRRELESELNGIRETVQELEQEYKNLQSVLKGSETHLQLQNLERKWAAVEQANFTIRSFVNSKRAEGNFSQLREKVFSLLSEHNKALQELGGRGPPMG
ncbi:unnamed protein product [Cyprideis torosa]|uniref:Uncharacterized protein n=2 Tax=Cyprideis torosa TaxID=163714 RepID=A0A7R8WGR1_9CRUS|nr:unnamed protein product [Cyprideis torosa]CAG0898461.1 unnamed protein product [Cyprideis torosa]